MDDIKNTLINITRNVGKTSGTFIKTAKLSVALSQEQDALKALYMEMGRKVHEIYQYGGSLGKFFDEKYRELENQERKISELKDEIARIKGVKECPKCGRQVDRNAEFCPKCGLRLEGAPPVGGEAPPPLSPASGPFTAAPPPETFAPPPGIPEVTAPPAPPPADYTAEPFPAPPQTGHARPSIAAAPMKTVRCRACGAENDTSTKFCLSCGRII